MSVVDFPNKIKAPLGRRAMLSIYYDGSTLMNLPIDTPGVEKVIPDEGTDERLVARKILLLALVALEA